MSAYTDAIGRARRLLDDHQVRQNRDEYKRALIELCAMFDPVHPMDEAIDKAEELINYNPERRVEFTINVPNMRLTDTEISIMIQGALREALLPITLIAPPEVSS